MEQAKKKLTDFSEFVRINSTVQALRSEKSEVSSRLDQIAIELSRRRQVVDGKESWHLALEGEGTVSRYAADNRSELRDDQLQLEGRLRFIDEALEVGEQERDKARGPASLEICATVRPAWVEQIGVILECLKKISESNQALDAMRASLEAEGIKTGSLPHCTYDLGGRWSDQYGGRLVGFQRYISEHYPELTAAAGMEIKAKLAALAKREEKFNNQGATE
jgi:hypothetical protein